MFTVRAGLNTNIGPMKMKTYLKLVVVLALFAPIVVGATTLSTINTPVAYHKVTPKIPAVSRDELKGEVLVLFRIDKEGRVQNIKVESAPTEEHAESVVNAVRQWRFEPVLNAEGKVVTPLVRLPVRFN